MGDMLFELFLALAELLLEVLLEVAGEALLDLAQRALAEVLKPTRIASPVLATTGYTLLGALAGGCSLVFFPHPLVHPSRLHGINLLVSPLITGLIMALIGFLLGGQGRKVVRIESFRYGFAFAFGMAVVRYFFVA